VTGFTYKSYSFIDKDPIIDEVRGVWQASGQTYKQVEEQGGVSAKTLHYWFDGATKRPQAATLNAVLRALGYKLGIVALSASSPPVPAPAPQQARPASTRHVVQMKKYRKGR
jgi:transcriptional regulator with XRE-family HTH domain